MTVLMNRLRGLGDNTVEENLEKWDRVHSWAEDGDEWKGQAALCGVPYEQWKHSLVDHLIVPYVGDDDVVLEVGSGHGRWTERILACPCSRLVIVDLSPNCLEFCRNRFSDPRLETFQTPGDKLPPDCTASVDFVWSYDSLVHVSAPQFRNYLMEISRVLKPGGLAVLHHGARRDSTLWLGWMRRFGKRGKRAYRTISMGRSPDGDGWRSNVSAERVARWAEQSGLIVRRQLVQWGNDGCGVPRFGDRISILQKAGTSRP